MQVRSVKVNYFLNFFRIASTALIGVFTMPYINRVLGADSLGKVEYVNTIINYFILFSALGIPMYGIREIAKVRDDLYLRSKTVVELLIILGVTSTLSYIFLFGVLYQLDFFASYKEIILLMSSMIILNNLGAEWYFQGMEDQLYITIRYVIIRVITLFLLFYLVKDSSDYLYYALIVVLTVCGSNLFNLFFLFKTIEFKTIKKADINIKQHIKPVLTIFIAAISVNIYFQLDLFLIGTISGDKYVGYYSVSNKLIRFVISFITIIGVVLLPRLSNLYATDMEKYNIYLKKSFEIILILSIPFSVYFFVASEEIITIMAGSDFKASILTMQILSPLCIIVGIAYSIGFLVLYTQNKERIYTKAVMFSAGFSVLVNYFAISYFQQNGAAVVAVLSELLAIGIMMFLAKKELKILKIANTNLVKVLIAAVVMFIAAVLISSMIKLDGILLFTLYSGFIFSLFILFLIVLKEDTTIYFKTYLISKFSRD